MYRLKEIAEAAISADGERIAYTVTSVDRDRDEYVSDVWLVRWDGGEALRLTDGPNSASSPRFSPDGRYLGFLTGAPDANESAQVWVLDLEGGDARQVSSLGHAVSDFTWSPDGKRMLLVAGVDPTPGDADNPQPIVIDRYYFKEDETGYLDDERQQLFVLDVASGAATRLTDDAFDNKEAAWSPDGERIVFVSKRGDDPDRHGNWDVYVMDATAGAKAVAVTDNPGGDDASWGGIPPTFSPDGRQLAYEHGGDPADIWYGLRQVGIAATDGGPTLLPARGLDRNSFSPRFAPDGASLLFLLEDDRTVQLARANLGNIGRDDDENDDAVIERLTPGRQVVTEFDVAQDGRVVVIASSPTRPSDLYKLERGRLVRLTTHNDALLAEADLVAAEEFAFESADDLRIHGLKLLPEGNAPHPTILRIHGGPVAQYQHEFDFEWQLFAANGYLVAGINPRGSSGRGEAFQKLLWADWGFADVPDVMAAVDHLVASGEADAGRLGVGGWSYGGILTNYVIASTDRFKAAISGAGMSNMLGGYGIDQYARDWEAELGLPWETTDTWLRLSYPFLNADDISTPTLFLCGAADYNVPLAASEQMYQALRTVGVPTRLVIYPDQYHSLTRPSFQYDKRQRYLDWYGQYLLIEAKATPTAVSSRR